MIAALILLVIQFISNPFFVYANGSDSVQFSIGYTLGTHKGSFTRVKSTLTGTHDPLTWKGRVSVKIADAEISGNQLKCHFMESLGLDYSVSGFPESHVCDSDDRLPDSGKDSVAYPEITFDLEKVVQGTGPDEFFASGTWSIHGKTQKTEKLRIHRIGDRFKASLDVKLPDFGIQVKNFLFISTSDTAKVEVDLAGPIP